MKNLLSVLGMLAIAQTTWAANISTTTCEDYSVSLNSVYSMKTYANESVKVFEIDMEEPASAPAGLAVAINRGNDLSTMETFCRFIPGLASVNVKGATSAYNATTNILTLKFAVTQSDENGSSISKKLTVKISKGAKNEEGLVKATLE